MARYVPNSRATGEILRSAGVQSLVQSHGNRLAAAAGDGFVASYQQGRSRYGGIIFADTWSAKHRDRRENILVRVLG